MGREQQIARTNGPPGGFKPFTNPSMLRVSRHSREAARPARMEEAVLGSQLIIIDKSSILAT